MLIIDAVRTARGRGNDKSALKALGALDVGRQVFAAIEARNHLDTEQVVDVVVGCATQHADQGSGIARLLALESGWSPQAGALTINRACASGLAAVHLAALQAQSTDGLAVGGGVEMMCRVPMGSDGGPMFSDRALQARLGLLPMGIAADAVASQSGFSRIDCDTYAAESQARAARAREQGWFASLVPVRDTQGQVLLAQDETPRPTTTVQTLAELEPAFAALGGKGLDAFACERLGLHDIEHVHHAGNSPAMADGASLVLLASEAAAQRNGLTPRARILGMADTSDSAVWGLTAGVKASRLALARAGLKASQIDLFEVNEAFAGVMLHYMRELQVPHENFNVNGGAIALGHALGSSGSALLGTLLDELERRGLRYGLVAIAGAAGVASAAVIERSQA
ncbi:TPA: acetyl-CoA C-acyltransferase [Pseudomonas aeruginosa]